MNYSDHTYMVRVDFYRADDGGFPRKWYTTEAVSFEGLYDEPLLVQDSVKEGIVRHLGQEGGGRIRLGGMIAVVAEPYHKTSFPVAIKVPEYA